MESRSVEILERCHKDFKLVLLDLIMPVMDGYQVLAVMKEKQWLDMLPVICISSETSEDSIRRVYGLGASDYFTRPFDAMRSFIVLRVRLRCMIRWTDDCGMR